MPSVWAYAKQAGMRTAYLDAQLTGGRLHSLMDSAERREIDEFTQFDAVPVRDRDMAVADKLAELLGNDRSEFILVNKVGAHFPIHDKYPDAFMRHRPVLPRGGWLNVAETGSRAGFGGSAEDWVRYRNAYRNTIEWNVGAFFDRLFARADLSRATIVYTSDHGQDLHERGNAGSNTHCGTDPAAEEGLVTLVAIEGEQLDTLPWEQNLAANRNRVSHYQIFPTLLALMGYDQAAVQPIYGDSLVVKSRDDFTFNTRFNARLGKEPVWKKIDLSSVVQPPAGDSEKP
jgi:lipid A ethanolaminephosphotransferase